MKCAACQAEVDANSVYCPRCGEMLTPVEEQAASETSASEAESDATASEEGAVYSAGPAETPQTASARLKERVRSAGEEAGEAEPADQWREGGYSPKALTGRFLLTALITAVILGLASWLRWNREWTDLWIWYVAAALVAILWIWYACVRIYRVGTIKYKLTRHQFYHEEGIFRRIRDVIEVIDIDDLKLERTLWDRILNGGVGTVIIHSTDTSNPELKMTGLADPERVFLALDDARRRERGLRGLKSV